MTKALCGPSTPGWWQWLAKGSTVLLHVKKTANPSASLLGRMWTCWALRSSLFAIEALLPLTPPPPTLTREQEISEHS